MALNEERSNKAEEEKYLDVEALASGFNEDGHSDDEADNEDNLHEEHISVPIAEMIEYEICTFNEINEEKNTTNTDTL